MAHGDIRQRASFDDAEAFGSSITRIYRPVFQDGAGREAAVTPVAEPRNPGFRASIFSHQIDDLVLSTVRASGHEVDYAGTVAPDDSALKIYYILEGTAVIRQGNREETLEQGQLGVHDSMNPYRVWTDTGFNSLIMVVPKTRLLTLGEGYADLRATRFTAGEGAGQMVLPYLQGLAGNLDEITRSHGRQVMRSTVDLLTLLFGTAVGTPEDSPEQRRAAQRRDITGWILEHLPDEDLSPGRIAAAHYMSLRSLHALFAETDTTVGAVVRQLRLELARELLIAHPTVPVAEIGRRSGFSDPSHFTRSFRRAFEHTPGEFRAAAADGSALPVK